MDSGANLYQNFLRGDDNSFIDIIRTYKDGLILYLNSFVNNFELAEELMEETFVKLVTKKPAFHEKSSFKTWLFAIGRNVALDYLRHQSRHSVLSLETLPEISLDEESLEQSYLREERRISLYRALRNLKPEYRQILHLIYFEEFHNADAALLLKKSRRQIETLIYRAKQALRIQLEKEGFSFEDL